MTEQVRLAAETHCVNQASALFVGKNVCAFMSLRSGHPLMVVIIEHGKSHAIVFKYIENLLKIRHTSCLIHFQWVFLLRRLKVIHRLNDIHHRYSIADIADNLVLWLIHHRRLVLGLFVHAFCIDALHGAGIIIQTDVLESLASAHDAACTVRSRAIPILVAFYRCR